MSVLGSIVQGLFDDLGPLAIFVLGFVLVGLVGAVLGVAEWLRGGDP